MQKVSVSWSVKQIKRMFEKGNISFDHPIQRKPGQWKEVQKSELIHSIADDYPVPPVYAIREDGVYYILDGKQRFSTIFSYVNNEFSIIEGIDDVIVEEEEFEIEGKFFDELDEEVQDQIMSYMILVYRMDVENDDEIERMFLKLNQGKALNNLQKVRAVLGVNKVKELEKVFNHSFFENKAHFTKSQLNDGGGEVIVLQTLMLMEYIENSEYKFNGFGTKDVYNFAKDIKENKVSVYSDSKLKVLEEVLDYMDEVFEYKDKKILKNVHLPIILVVVSEYIDDKLSVIEFREWVDEFKKEIDNKNENHKTIYREYMGQGASKKDKVNGRYNVMSSHFADLFFDTRKKKIS